MGTTLSVIIPAHNEARYIGRCLESIARSAAFAGTKIRSGVGGEVEIVVALNRCTDATRAIAEAAGARCVVEDQRCIAAIRNTAVRASTGERVVTLDADSWMGEASIAEVHRHLDDDRYIGGGAAIRPERISLGIVMSMLAIAPYLIGRGVSGGMFWLRRRDFDAIGGFDESLVSLEDFDFGRRLKAHGARRGQRYGTLRRGRIYTSCRKFDQFGDWYLFKNPRLVRRIFAGRDRAAADSFYYDTDR